jgi:hypothetical protein
MVPGQNEGRAGQDAKGWFRSDEATWRVLIRALRVRGLHDDDEPRVQGYLNACFDVNEEITCIWEDAFENTRWG